MRCNQVQDQLDAYHDHELASTDTEKIAGHLTTCVACRSQYAALQEMSDMISETGRYETPAGLGQHLQQTLDREQATAGHNLTGLRGYQQLGYGLVAGLLLGVLGHVWYADNSSHQQALVQWLVSEHIDAQLADHFLDIASSNQHNVKPWFNGKVDYAVPVKDLKDEGFNLLGGRIDYNGKKAIAALGYRFRQHVINLFIWPEQTPMPADLKQRQYRGYNLSGWEKEGLWYLAVSDLNVHDMQRLKVLYESR